MLETDSWNPCSTECLMFWLPCKYQVRLFFILSEIESKHLGGCGVTVLIR